MQITTRLSLLPMLTLTCFLGCSDDDERLPGTSSKDAGTLDSTTLDGDVHDTGTVIPDTGTVVPDAGAPDSGQTTSAVGTMEIGPITIGASGDSSEISFDLPAGTTSFILVIDGPNEGTYIIRTMDGPSGNLVSNDASNVTPIEQLFLGPFAAQFKGPNRVVQDEGEAAAFFPNNPFITVAGGTYTLVVASVQMGSNTMDPFPTDVTIKIFYRTEVVTTGHLDVNLYFTGTGGLTAATAPTNQMMIDALNHVRTIYGQADITIGSVSYFDIDSSFSTIDSFTGPNSQLNQMFQLTAPNGPGLHYFMVDRFEGGPMGGGIGGIAGGLPGPPLWVGSNNAGVAVAVTMAEGDAAMLAHVMAHEGGHWLGLFHTSEMTGSADQLPDTPEGQAGDTYLMYPAVGGGQQISSNQAEVMRQHMEVVGQ